MVKNCNYFENDDSKKNPVKCSEAVFNWQKPLQVIQWFFHLIRSPIDAIRLLVLSGETAGPVALIILNVISVFIASILCVIFMKLKYSLYFSWIHIPSAGIILLMTLFSAIFDFGFAGLLFVSTSIIFKGKAGFTKILSMVSGKVIIDSVFILAGSILMLIGNFFFFSSVMIGNILSITILITIYNEEIKLPSLKKIYSFSAAFAASFIIMIIMWRIAMSLLAALNPVDYMSLLSL